MDNAVVNDKAVPPVNVLYHFSEVPVATKLETEAEVQNICAAAVGAPGALVIVTDTDVLELSHEFKVCDT